MSTLKVETKEQVREQKLPARSLWGKLTTYLREHNNIVLHIVCGDITDVETENDCFIVNTTQDYIYNLLQEEHNHKEMQKAFEYLGYKKFEIRLKQKGLSHEDNIKILNKYFNDKVKIK